MMDLNVLADLATEVREGAALPAIWVSLKRTQTDRIWECTCGDEVAVGSTPEAAVKALEERFRNALMTRIERAEKVISKSRAALAPSATKETDR